MPTIIYADGSMANVCYIIGDNEPVVKPTVEEAYLPVTSNMAEYYALLYALQAAKSQGIRDILVFADSELMVKQLTLRTDGKKGFVYQTRNAELQNLRRLVVALQGWFDSVRYQHVPRGKNKAGLVLDKLARQKRRY